MIFPKRAKKNSNLEFHIGKEYKYKFQKDQSYDQVMIFQKRAKKNSSLEFHIGKETIDIVHEYTYLGTRISSTGNFHISLEHLKETALHALFSLTKPTNFSKLKPSLACKIVEAMIFIILS